MFNAMFRSRITGLCILQPDANFHFEFGFCDDSRGFNRRKKASLSAAIQFHLPLIMRVEPGKLGIS